MRASVLSRVNLLADGRCLTVLPKSVMAAYGKRDGIAVLPIRLPQKDWPVVMATLKGRTLNPVTALFMEAVRAGLGTK
jgi:DNA-binding transcriptional LysR family regulator